MHAYFAYTDLLSICVLCIGGRLVLDQTIDDELQNYLLTIQIYTRVPSLKKHPRYVLNDNTESSSETVRRNCSPSVRVSVTYTLCIRELIELLGNKLTQFSKSIFDLLFIHHPKAVKSPFNWDIHNKG